MCKYRVDQHLIVLNSVITILVLEFMTESFTKSKLDVKNDEMNNLVGTCSQK